MSQKSSGEKTINPGFIDINEDSNSIDDDSENKKNIDSKDRST
jgi:hypothetical protein